MDGVPSWPHEPIASARVATSSPFRAPSALDAGGRNTLDDPALNHEVEGENRDRAQNGPGHDQPVSGDVLTLKIAQAWRQRAAGALTDDQRPQVVVPISQEADHRERGDRGAAEGQHDGPEDPQASGPI